MMMKRSEWLWRMIGLVSAAGTALMLFGFGYAIKTVLYPEGSIAAPASSATPPFDREASIDIVALGDSLTAGFGDPTGKGYVRRLQERLEAHSEVPVYVAANFAQNGYTTSQVLADLRERRGIVEALRRADIVLITAGGNDLFRLGGEIDVEAMRNAVPQAQSNLRDILVRVHDIAPDARVYYIGLYNPFIGLEEIEGTSLAVQAWNYAAFETLEPFRNATFVPTFDLFQADIGTYVASDNYHLNDAGYAKIAERLGLLME